MTLPAFAARKCETPLGKLATAAAWRKAHTHSDPAGGASKTDAARETKIKQVAQGMEGFILGHHDVPEMELIPEAGSPAKLVNDWHMNDRKNARFEFSGVGKAPVFKGTLLLPVSGHVGGSDAQKAANARKFSKTDTYQIELEDGDGHRSWLVPTTKSLDLVTMQDVSVTLKKGRTMKLLYHRSGSGGPGGFPTGRTIELYWDGT
jgi:hypothetical protein